MDINVKVNPIYLPYLNKKQFIQVFFGGSSSGKSYFLAQKIVIDNLKGVNWLCCRNVARTIRNSTFNEIIKAISNMNLKKMYIVNKTDMVITCKSNEKQILFAGLDDVEKVKSITPRNGVLERIFIEEATEIKREAFKQLTKRLRGYSQHSKHILIAFNPILKSHWIYKEFFNLWQDNKTYYEDNEKVILKTTFKNNLFLTQEDKLLLENESDPYFYNVYSLGNWGVLGNVIFKNWVVEDLKELMPHFDKIYCGMDFGYASDPNALIKAHYDKSKKTLYVFDEYYCCGMSDNELLNVSKSFFKNEFVACDSAEPKTIDYLAASGINTFPALKGADSINRGIRWLQGQKIVIDLHCQNFKNEIEQYHWLEDKYGVSIAKPVDANNHLLDALRYATECLQTNTTASAGVRF